MKLSMLKTLFLSIFFFIASTLLIANVALSHPLPQHLFAQTPIERPSQENVQPEEPRDETSTARDRTSSENTSERQQNDRSSQRTTSDRRRSQSEGPYDMEAIKAFNRALYGS